MVEFTRIDNEGRHAIDVDGYPHGVIRIENGKVKRLMIHSETTNVIPTQDLLRAIADKLDTLNQKYTESVQSGTKAKI